MSKYNVEVVKGSQNTPLGEGPHWRSDKNEILYLDVFANKIHRLVPSTGESGCVTLDVGPVTIVTPVESIPNKFLIGAGRNVHVMEWDGVSSKPTSLQRLYSIEDPCETNRLNDGKCDAAGRLWAGTMTALVPGKLESVAKCDADKGNLYSFGTNGEVKKHFGQVSMSNGLTWTNDSSVFYHIDSFNYRVDAFDYDLAAREISNRRTAFDFKANGVDGLPDGMTIDANGNLWVATFLGQKVVHIDPKVGKQIGQVDLPTKNITSVAFGGPNLDILFVTSASRLLSESELASQPLAGALFQVTNLGTRGIIGGFNFKGKI